MHVDEYSRQMEAHLEANGQKVPRTRAIAAIKSADEFLDNKTHLLSEDETAYIRQQIKSKAVPTPKLLIKDHKEKDARGNFPTRLVIPANNFVAAIDQVGYLGIKRIFDKSGINYMAKTIVQASDLKEKLESLDLKEQDTTIASIDVEDFYPSVKAKLVKAAIRDFAQDLPEEEKQVMEECIEMIQFGM